MGVGSVIATFVMCFLFNIILPTGDVGSDIKLMYSSLTFNLGESLQLEGCKSCYHKSEKEVYYPEEDFSDNECKTCLFDPHLGCGVYLQSLKKIREYGLEKQFCLEEVAYFTDQDKIEFGECDEENDKCWMKAVKEAKEDAQNRRRGGYSSYSRRN